MASFFDNLLETPSAGGNTFDAMAGQPSAAAPPKKKRPPKNQEHSSLIGRALDLLRRGEYATGSFADALGKGLFDGKPDTWPELGQRFQEGLAAAKEGFAGRDTDGWQRLAHRLPEGLDVRLPDAPAGITPDMAPGAGGLGIALSKALSGKHVPVRGTLGFVASVMADPVNQVGLGAKVINQKTGTATRQALSFAGKGWEDLPGVAGKVAEAVDTKVGAVMDGVADWVRITPLGKWFAEKLSTRGAVADDAFADLTQQARKNAEYLVEKEIGKGVSREKALRVVVKNTGIPEGDLLDLIERPEVALTQRAANTFGAHTVTKGETLEKIAKKYGTTADDLKELNGIDRLMDLKMGQQLKVPVTAERAIDRLADKPQAAVDLVKQYGAENVERLGIERAAGIDTPALDSDVLEYMHRHRTPEAVKAARKAGVGWRPMLDTTVQHGATKQRALLKDLSIKQINDLSQKGALDSVIPGFRGKLYEDNPALVQTLRDVMSAKALAASEFLDGVIKNPAWATAAEAPETWVELSEKAIQNRFGSKVKGVKFRPDIAEALQKYVRDEFDPKQVDGFWKVYDKALGVWKEFTLGLSPSWIKNNVLGNTFNNYLQGVTPSEYARAAAIQNGRPVLVAAQSGKSYTAEQVKELAGRLRVTDAGLYGADVRKTIEQQISGKGQGALQQTSFRANRAIENNARLANFIDGLRKGLSPENAAKRVNDTLFDYGDLTDWEKNVAKRIMPFYTWYKKNATLQLEMMATKPGKYTVIPKAADAIEYGQKERGELADKANLPAWLKDAYPVQTGTTPEGNVRYMTGRGVPALDMLKSPNELASANPMLTAIMQAALGYDPYLGRVIDKEPSSLLGIPMEQRYASAVQSLAPPLKNLNTMLNPQDASPWSTVSQPDLGERLKGLVFGKTYERDPGADSFYAAKDWLSQMRQAQKALAEAEANGNQALAWWWRQRIAELEKQEPR